MTEIILKVRSLIGDELKTDGKDVFTYETASSSKVFTLTSSNVSSATIIVYKNGVVWSAANYTYSTTTGKLTVTGSLTAGDSLQVTYSYYKKYSDTEMQGFIKSAVIYISVEAYKTFKVS